MLFNLHKHTLLDLGDALFLTKNLLREFKDQLLLKQKLGTDAGTILSALNRDYDHFGMEYPFSSVMNLIFPIDSKVQYNISNSSYEFAARYASFSPIVDYNIDSEYGIMEDSGCKPFNASEYEYLQDKIVVVMRGECTFVQKINNILESGLNAQAILVANNVANRGLVTMYSPTFNQDGTLRTPVLFIAYENYQQLDKLSADDIELRIAAAALGGWINWALSVMLSPPLVIIVFYSIIRCGQILKKKHTSRENEQLVRRLKVFIYNKSHLIPASDFYDYIRVTNQTQELEDAQAAERNSVSDSSSIETSRPGTPSRELPAMVCDLNILVPPDDYFNASKCSICLERFHPLRSRVLLLNCKHFFHEQCLSNWLVNFKRSCPLCNNSLKLSLLWGLSHRNYGAMEESVGIDAEQRHPSSDARAIHPTTEDHTGHADHASYHETNAAVHSVEGIVEGIVGGSSGQEFAGNHEELLAQPQTQANSAGEPADTTASFVTAKTHLEQPAPQPPRTRPRTISRPSQLLSFTTLNPNSRDLSSSIDSQ